MYLPNIYSGDWVGRKKIVFHETAHKVLGVS